VVGSGREEGATREHCLVPVRGETPGDSHCALHRTCKFQGQEWVWSRERHTQARLAYHWPTTGLPLAYHWPTTGLPLAYRWPTTGLPLAYHWPTMGLFKGLDKDPYERALGPL